MPIVAVAAVTAAVAALITPAAAAACLPETVVPAHASMAVTRFAATTTLSTYVATISPAYGKAALLTAAAAATICPTCSESSLPTCSAVASCEAATAMSRSHTALSTAAVSTNA